MGQGCEVPVSRGSDGGSNFGPIWPWLAGFTPSREAENEASVASFGTPFTRTRWAGVALLPIAAASLRVAKSGETFKTVSFGLIWSHSLSSALWGNTLIRSLLPSREKGPEPLHPHRGQGCEVPVCTGTTGTFVGTAHANNVAIGRATAQWAVIIVARKAQPDIRRQSMDACSIESVSLLSGQIPGTRPWTHDGTESRVTAENPERTRGCEYPLRRPPAVPVTLGIR